MTIAKRVRDCRYAKGWGPDELASRAAISRTALYQIECGKTETPRAGTLRRIAEALGVSIESLLGNEEPRPAEVAARVNRPEPAPLAWTPEPENRLAAYSFAPSPSSREQDLQRMLHDVLHSPMGDGIARLIEESHRLLATAQRHFNG